MYTVWKWHLSLQSSILSPSLWELNHIDKEFYDKKWLSTQFFKSEALRPQQKRDYGYDKPQPNLPKKKFTNRFGFLHRELMGKLQTGGPNGRVYFYLSTHGD